MQAEAMIAGLNANLPKKLDAISSLTRIDFQNNAFIYYIKSERKIVNKQDFYNRMREQLKSACSNDELNPLIKSNLKLTYIYSDPDTPNAATVVISKADCPNM